MALRSLLVALSCVATAATVAGSVHAQQARAAGPASAKQAAAGVPGADQPGGFVIGPEDVLSIVFSTSRTSTT